MSVEGAVSFSSQESASRETHVAKNRTEVRSESSPKMSPEKTAAPAQPVTTTLS